MCCCEGDWECVDNKCVVVKGTGNVECVVVKGTGNVLTISVLL